MDSTQIAAQLLDEAKHHRQLADQCERAARIFAPAKTANGKQSKATGKRGRPLGSGQRDKQALEYVRQHPGALVSEVGRALGITPNYLYRVMPALVEEGLLREESNGNGPKRYSAVEADVSAS